MTQNGGFELPWSQKLDSYLAQAKHCADTNNFASFHKDKLQHITEGIAIARLHKANDIPHHDVDALNNINISSVEQTETAFTLLDRHLKVFKINENLPDYEMESLWAQKLQQERDDAIRSVLYALDAGTENARALILAMPEDIRQAAAQLYLSGMEIATGALDFMSKKISGLYNSVADFINKIWTALDAAWVAVYENVGKCKTGICHLYPLPIAESNPVVNGVSHDNKPCSSQQNTNGFSGPVLDLSWPSSVTFDTITLATLYYMQRYRQMENQYDTWFTQPIKHDGDDRFHSAFGITSCNNPSRAQVAMSVVLGLEQKRKTPIPDEYFSGVPTPDPVAFSKSTKNS